MIPKVSVVITSYNAQNVIKRLLDSVFSQIGLNETFSMEVILVDDHSKDNTLEIAELYDVIIIKTIANSGGPNKGRNLGLEKASGDCIVITDHDDEWEKHKIITQLPLLKIAPIVTSGYTYFEGDNIKLIKNSDKQKKHIFFEKNKTFLAKLTKSKNAQNVYLGSILFSSELKHIRFEEHFGMVDYDWVLRMFKDQTSVESCDTLYIRHVHTSNLSRNETYRRIDYYYSLLFVERYISDFPKEVELSMKRINGSRGRFFYFNNEMKLARLFFRRSEFSYKILGYYLTSFLGAKFVQKRVKIIN